MTTFFIIALVIALAGSAIVLAPLLKHFFKGGHKESRPGLTLSTGILVALLLPLASLFLYSRWSTWDWAALPGPQSTATADETHSMEDAIASLEQRLAQQPDDIQGWQMLGRSYMNLRRFADAARAFRRVVDLSGPDATAAQADYGEALFLSDARGMQGDAGELFRDLVDRAPDNPKVMWYGGLAAFEIGDDAEGRRLWSQLRGMDLPPEMQQIIEERLGATDAATASPAMASTTGSGAQKPNAKPVAAGDIRVSIELDPALRDRIVGTVPLFIFARRPAGGPPLAAVRRSSSEIPLSIDLSDANAMMQGIKISDQEQLTLIARLSMSGSPRERPGDLFGKIEYSRDSEPKVTIRIDQVVP
ncbi:MAG: tetratricopeptide repeat protein [Gammaproteobacteria bacterium]|nr:MAG: tetratricopeptide repeat protein [Gammaproteobacteria bacterium]